MNMTVCNLAPIERRLALLERRYLRLYHRTYAVAVRRKAAQARLLKGAERVCARYKDLEQRLQPLSRIQARRKEQKVVLWLTRGEYAKVRYWLTHDFRRKAS